MRSKGVGPNSRKYGMMEEQTAFTFKISQHITYMRHFHNATHRPRRNLAAIVFHTLHFREYNSTAGYTDYSFYGFLAYSF
jgi:hypothetical protein